MSPNMKLASRMFSPEAAMAAGLISIIVVMTVPVPSIAMDILIALNISISIAILLVSLYVEKPLDFSVFPSLLLIVTLFRLSLNVATTKLILLNGHDGSASAGKIIESFGQLVVGGNYVVGIMVFIILVIINFMVITKGSGRVAEVAARFVLDSLPGRQMSIDADLNAGIISPKQARDRRADLDKATDFYGAMDGASKFVRGDAIAGILITGINIVAGIIVGVVQQGLDAGDAAKIYTVLTVGDGLVAQIPALLISTAAGLVITRSASSNNLGVTISGQVLKHSKALVAVAAILGGFALVPGMPTFSLLALGGLFFGLSRLPVPDLEPPEEDDPMAMAEAEEEPVDEMESLLQVDTLALEIGFGLVPLVDAKNGGELLERITHIRSQIGRQLGVIVPPIHIRDNLKLKPNEYKLLLRGVEIVSHVIHPDRLLAMNPDEGKEDLKGVEGIDPAFGMPVVWIRPNQRAEAEKKGYMVVEPSTVIATHLNEVIKENAHELIGRQEVHDLLEILKKHNPKLVEEVIPDQYSVGDLLAVCHALLQEQVSIRDLRTILEAISDVAGKTKNPDVLAELVRQRLARYLTQQFIDHDGKITAVILEPKVEELARSLQQVTDNGLYINFEPEITQMLATKIDHAIELSSRNGALPVLLTPPEIRRGISNLFRGLVAGLNVLSYREVDSKAQINLTARIGMEG